MDDLIQANLELHAELEKANSNLSEYQNEVKRLNTDLNNCIEEGQMLKIALANQSNESKLLIYRLKESLAYINQRNITIPSTREIISNVLLNLFGHIHKIFKYYYSCSIRIKLFYIWDL